MHTRPFGTNTIFFAVLLLFSLLHASLFAQEEAPVPAHADEPALLAMGPRMVSVLRASIYGYTPKARAELARQRIHEALRDKEAGEFSTVAKSEGTMIYYGSHLIVTILHGDLDHDVEETMEQKVGMVLAALKAGFEQHRRSRDPKVIAGAVGRSLVYTLVYLAVVAAMFAASSRFTQFLRNRKARSAASKLLLVEAAIIAKRLAVALLALGLTLAWLSFVLQAFPQTEVAGASLAGTFGAALSGLVESIVSSTPNMLIAALIGTIAMAVLRCLNATFKAILAGRMKLSGIDAEVARPTITVIKILVVLVALMAAYPYLPGTSSEAFKGISIMGGLMVSLGSATLFGQISAGFVLMYSGAFKKDDWIVVGEGTEGRLVEIGYLTTRVQTFREEIYIPNLVLLGQASRNLSRAPIPDVAPLAARVSIGYDAPWRQVYRLLEEAAAATPDIAAEPPPLVHQIELGDFYVVYELTAYINRSTPRRAVRSNLFENIQDSFNAAGVQIMSPHFEGPPEDKIVIPREKWEGRGSDERPT